MLNHFEIVTEQLAAPALRAPTKNASHDCVLKHESLGRLEALPEHDYVLKMIAKLFAKPQHGEVRVANLKMHRGSSAFEQPSFRLRDNQPSQSLSANFWLYPYGVNPALVPVERNRGTCNHVTGLLSKEN